MNTELEIERLNIALQSANQCMDTLSRRLAEAHLENRRLGEEVRQHKAEIDSFKEFAKNQCQAKTPS